MKSVEQIRADQDHREMMRRVDAWPHPYCPIKHKDWTSLTDDDIGKGMGVILAVRDYDKGEVAVLLDHNIMMPLESSDGVKTMTVDELINSGWIVD
jgi:hypothetical protein